ncbi:hypothetical protein GXW82_34070 [Streptacidiphilus sp. 4-A2]|nr:hypothetical protein [Streptacidiphilus sp. 4-A2]
MTISTAGPQSWARSSGSDVATVTGPGGGLDQGEEAAVLQMELQQVRVDCIRRSQIVV